MLWRTKWTRMRKTWTLLDGNGWHALDLAGEIRFMSISQLSADMSKDRRILWATWDGCFEESHQSAAGGMGGLESNG